MCNINREFLAKQKANHSLLFCIIYEKYFKITCAMPKLSAQTFYSTGCIQAERLRVEAGHLAVR